MVMYYSLFDTLTAIELIGLRGGFSIYSGWVSGASILNICHTLKAYGISKENGYNEVRQCTVTTWIAFAIYATAGVLLRNPLYSLIFMHVLNALRAETK